MLIEVQGSHLTSLPALDTGRYFAGKFYSTLFCVGNNGLHRRLLKKLCFKIRRGRTQPASTSRMTVIRKEYVSFMWIKEGTRKAYCFNNLSSFDELPLNSVLHLKKRFIYYQIIRCRRECFQFFKQTSWV